ncbi:hypothetical protein PhaeoP72_01152 [Phaeobacter inhibens]|nr:hypothetical protein PhaeoP72_01152 [Phaeobacter inhibens]
MVTNRLIGVHLDAVIYVLYTGDNKVRSPDHFALVVKVRSGSEMLGVWVSPAWWGL